MAPNIEEPIFNTSSSAIATFFHNKTIFITGATGFVGKCLLEKLVRSCPGINNILPISSTLFFVHLDVERIHILVRNKHGTTPIERLTKLCSSPV